MRAGISTGGRQAHSRGASGRTSKREHEAAGIETTKVVDLSDQLGGGSRFTFHGIDKGFGIEAGAGRVCAQGVVFNGEDKSGLRRQARGGVLAVM